VDNNAYTNRLAQWNLQTALELLDWLKQHAANKANQLIERLDLGAERLNQWRDVIEKTYLHIEPSGLIEQFEGYYQRKDIDLAALEPRTISAQVLFGIEGCNETQILKQPDVLMLQYLLRQHYSDESVRVNYDYYQPRTDHTYGSSLGPSIMTIMACDVGKPDDAYEHFIRAVRADLRDVRGNAEDGIHAASAGGTWQAVVFGFGGLRVTPEGWTTQPRLPKHWKRLAFRFFHRGMLQEVDIKAS
jgi:kojibiose phosphorylase